MQKLHIDILLLSTDTKINTVSQQIHTYLDCLHTVARGEGSIGKHTFSPTFPVQPQ